MKISDISEIHLAAIVAGATLFGGLLTSFANFYLLDANTEKETSVKILEIALSILSKPINPDVEISDSEISLRSWAFDTMNSVSEIKFEENVRSALVNGDASFNTYIGEFERIVK